MPAFRWSPTIGDPTLVGWLTVAAYFSTSWLCLRAFMSEKAGPPRPYVASVLSLLRLLRRHWPRPPIRAQRAFIWLVLAVALGALGVNKQLDLQTLFTDITRVMAFHQGWYDHRRPVQVTFLIVLASASLFVIFALLRLVRNQLRDFLLPLIGMTLLSLFVVSRAASFHHVDLFLEKDLWEITINNLLELTGIAMIGIAAILRLKAKRSAAR